ncbi:MAG: response regulator [Candidatus Omnitrophica bacterium]|nr:response regulator [Candidatus Omnitrophota bacterium]
MRKHILIIEDEEDIVELIRYNLEREGFVIHSAENGEDGLRLTKNLKPSLVILDLMLPGIDGLEVAKRMKKDDNPPHIPIIMLTAKTGESDVIVGLELGADDYIKKPFSPKVLIARVKAVLRRYEVPINKKRIKIGNLIIDSIKHKVTLSERDISLTITEFKLLEFMAQRPGVVLTRNNLLDGVFGYASEVYDRTIDAHIKSLRKKLGRNKDYIETVRGVGYRFKEILKNEK